MVDRRACRDLLCKLSWDKTFRFTKRQKRIYTPIYPRVNKTVTKAFIILTSSAVAPASADVEECRNFGTFIANKLRNYLPPTSSKLQHTISRNTFATDLRLFYVSYPVCTPSPASWLFPPPLVPLLLVQKTEFWVTWCNFKLCKPESSYYKYSVSCTFCFSVPTDRFYVQNIFLRTIHIFLPVSFPVVHQQ
jgi:hypothetical protein